MKHVLVATLTCVLALALGAEATAADHRVCHAAAADGSGKLKTNTHGQPMLSTEPCVWYRVHGLRLCAAGEGPSAHCYTYAG
jgi:hypothetical protein